MKPFACLIAGVLWLPAGSPAARTTVTVGQGGGYDHETIQAAIDAATTGDTVLVHPGTYFENINFRGRSIILRSTVPTSPPVVAATIIDGRSSDSVVTFTGTETSACVLAGFTLLRGEAAVGGGVGGNGTHATIRQNLIRNNSSEIGGGLFDCDGLIEGNTIASNTTGVWSCDGTIRANTISSNTASFGAGLSDCNGTIEGNSISGNASHGIAIGYGTIRGNTIAGNAGAGIALAFGAIEGNMVSGNMGGGLFGCVGPIRNNLIADNQADNGAGLHLCNGGPWGVIEHNTITGNAARNRGGGLYNCGDRIQYNIIAGNSAGGAGGGLAGCGGTFRNNLIAGNAALLSGGGLASCRGTMENVTIVANTAGDGGGLSDCDAAMIDCIVWGNTATTGAAQLAKSAIPTYSCIEGWTGGGEGNIAVDPRFVDPDGPDNDPFTHADNDYRLAAGSPCIDTGKNVYLFGWPIHDLDGDCRLIRSALDMGCYEFASGPDADGDLLSDAEEAARGTNPNNPDTDGDQLADGLEMVRGSDPAVATPPGVIQVLTDYPTIQEAIYMAVAGDQLVLPQGVYLEPVDFAGRNITLRSRGPNAPQTVAATILEGNVLFAGSETSGCQLLGITVREGGIAGNGTHALLARNVITSSSGVSEFDGTIRDNLITDNPGRGLTSCDGTIERNVIRDNEGGGLFLCNGLIQNNTIIGNSAIQWCWPPSVPVPVPCGKGGGLFNCDGIIQNNVIANNTCNARGEGLANCDGTIRNNLITGNGKAYENGNGSGSQAAGGGLFECNGTIVNNTIADNEGGGLVSCEAAISNCIIWGNTRASVSVQVDDCTTPIYSCIQGWTGGGEGNFALDPAFVDPDGPDDNPGTPADNDFHLTAASPCIDTGDPDPAADDAALPPGLGTERNDMGAYGGPHNDGWLVTGFLAPDFTGSLTGVGASPLIAGRPIALAGSIVNQGNWPAFKPCWVEFWAVDRLSGTRLMLCDSFYLQPLGAGRVLDLAAIPRRVVYDTVPAGDYAIEMRVDATDVIVEWSESNNVARGEGVVILPDRPNLSVVGFDFSPQAVDPGGGDALSLFGEIRNTGVQSTTGGFWIEFRVSGSLPFNPAGPYLCDSLFVSQTLAVGETIDLGALPPRAAYALPTGVYHIGIVIDPLDEVAEQREDDNVRWIRHRKLHVGIQPSRAKTWTRYR